MNQTNAAPETTETEKAASYIHKFKCVYCGLHFEAISWHENFVARFCPECGKPFGGMHFMEPSNRQIYEMVPGPTPLVGWINA